MKRYLIANVRNMFCRHGWKHHGKVVLNFSFGHHCHKHLIAPVHTQASLEIPTHNQNKVVTASDAVSLISK